MALLSALGSAEFGGHGVIPGGVDITLVGLSALGFYFWAVRAGVRAHRAGLPGPDPVLGARAGSVPGARHPEPAETVAS
ncbi:hypothetical protein ACFQ2B_33515 [Streptomyces stramineus]